ncbi:hypothetical protein CB0940_08120 [Cercospora beticola]|uniref:Myb-like domain-containing protein n=1 Tax=Cercospora beticola TaxID=122368 RepID=A0A2G5HPM3_CERBT|nr:hypothetical protein CB0940_08120 [Cercospora beticola]PIA94494.1 hypothetical protein CB0940_08120 [Cercospora beticola]WPB04687.1 hypothetical protein RHO25_009334 [Cercospora beticola]
MAGLLCRLVFRPRVITTWIEPLPLRGHGLLPIIARSDCISACRRHYHASSICSQNRVNASVDGASSSPELTAEDRRRIDELWESYETVGTIAKTLNRRLFAVWRYLPPGSSFGQRRILGWTDDDHNKVRELRDQGLTWQKIAEKLGRSHGGLESYLMRARCISAGGRSNVYSLEERDQAVNLQKQGLRPTSIAHRLGRPVATVNHMLRSRMSRYSWTLEDIEKVLTLREAGMSWHEITALLPGSRRTALEALYSRATRDRKLKGPAKKILKVPWSQEEDAKLLQLRNVRRLSLDQISKLMSDRSRKAIWHRYMDIDASLKRDSGYSLEELEKIARLRAAGMKFKDVAARIPGRTYRAVSRIFGKFCKGKFSVDERGNVNWHERPPYMRELGRDGEA